MNTYRIYTRKAYGLDNRVWGAMLVTIVLSLGILGYCVSGNKNATPIDFTIHSLEEHTGNTYTLGEILILKAGSNASNISWDFGDKSEKETGPSVKHKYLAEGNYYITVGTSPATTTGKWISIVKAIDSNLHLMTGMEITGASNTVAKRTELFTCTIPADNYEWSISNIPGTIKGQTVRLSFPFADKFIVQVILDRDIKKRYRKEVNVEDSVAVPETPVTQDLKPLLPESPAENNQAELITPEGFKSILEKVVYNEASINDFDKYLCGKGTTKVILNGDRKNPMSLVAVCAELKGKKTRKNFLTKKRMIKIGNVGLERGDDNCVQLIKIDYN